MELRVGNAFLTLLLKQTPFFRSFLFLILHIPSRDLGWRGPRFFFFFPFMFVSPTLPSSLEANPLTLLTLRPP